MEMTPELESGHLEAGIQVTPSNRSQIEEELQVPEDIER